MRDFFKRHRAVHLWLLGALGLYAAYFLGISSRGAANAVSAATQVLKDACARFWYLFPFSVVEWFYAAFIAAVIALLAVLFHRVRTWRGRRLDGACGCVLSIACLFLTAGGLYCLLWGVNYYADGFQERSGVCAQAEVSVEELERVTALFADRLADLADRVERDESGVFAVSRDEIFAASTGIYGNISREFPFLAREDRTPKRMVFSRLFSAMGFTGFYSPYTGESNLNVDCPACLLPATIAHELAHQRGIASEQECNFLAVLAATASENPAYVYSGWLMGYIYLSNALYSLDPDAYWAIRETLPETVQADLADNNAYWAQFRDSAAKKVSSKVYDSMLKAYGDERGIQSYGTVVDLLVVYYK